MSVVGIYHPGTSWLHRLPAGAKLLGLLLVITALLLAQLTAWGPALTLVTLACAVLLYPAASVPLRVLWRHAKVVLPFLVLIAGFQFVTASWQRAVVIAGQLLVAVLLAALVTATTRVFDMLALFEKLTRPLDRIGISSRRVSLVLALTVRCVPMVATVWTNSRDAYRARGLRRGSWRIAVPVIVRLLRSADSLGDAITARGVDVPPSREPRRSLN